MVTIKDVAREAGVSIATVSAVVNNSRPVASKTRTKVAAVIERLGYRPNRAARTLKVGRSHRILYITPPFHDLLVSELVCEVQDALSASGYDLILYSHAGRQAEAPLAMLADSDIDGVIITQSSVYGQAIAQACRDRQIPLVTLFSPHALDGVLSVVTDENAGADAVVAHLVGLRHQRIGFVTLKDNSISERRLAACQAALVRRGLDLPTEKVIQCSSRSEVDAQAHTRMHLDAGGLDFTALVCSNDYLALGAMSALKKAGVEVPKTVSVVGYNDSVGRFADPALTTVTFPKKELAWKAVDSLLAKIRGRDEAANTSPILFPEDLVIRESTHLPGGHVPLWSSQTLGRST